MKNLHKDDKALWQFIEATARRYADIFGLRLKRILPLPRREWNSCFGFCYEDGVIQLGTRHRGNLDEAHVILDTLAHELAHLAHMKHDHYWLALFSKIVYAMAQDGVLDRLAELCDNRR
jgi:hypothetical protein